MAGTATASDFSVLMTAYEHQIPHLALNNTAQNVTFDLFECSFD